MKQEDDYLVLQFAALAMGGVIGAAQFTELWELSCGFP